MLFNSYIFIFVFLPLALLGYFWLNHFHKYHWANLYLTGMSLWFYGYFSPHYLPIICCSILINYILSRILVRMKDQTIYRKVILGIGISLNAISIFVFKYYDFFVSNINSIFQTDFNLMHLVLPLGISFFTFQQIGYLVDSYRYQTCDHGFVEYALFVSFFPQLIAGPIVLHSEILPQFRDTSQRKFNSDNASKGLYIFAIGLFKKVLIADTFAKMVDSGYSMINTLSSLEAILVSLAYTFQLYFDFSGYCDMAIGIGYMFNIEITQNFNSPYKATSIQDFWGRWHMSLTRFLRQYLYFPLGGSRRGTLRTYVNIMIVFLVSGIWHGANWTFIVWGVLHGAANCINRMINPLWKKMNIVTQWMLTFLFVNLMWIVFRADSLAEASQFINRMLSMNDFSIRYDLVNCFSLPELTWLQGKIPLLGQLFLTVNGLPMWIFFIGAFAVVLNAPNSKELVFRPTFTTGFFTILLLVWSIISLAGVSTFLYWNF